MAVSRENPSSSSIPLPFSLAGYPHARSLDDVPDLVPTVDAANDDSESDLACLGWEQVPPILLAQYYPTSLPPRTPFLHASYPPRDNQTSRAATAFPALRSGMSRTVSSAQPSSSTYYPGMYAGIGLFSPNRTESSRSSKSSSLQRPCLLPKSSTQTGSCSVSTDTAVVGIPLIPALVGSAVATVYRSVELPPQLT